jgi:hypothetical protein
MANIILIDNITSTHLGLHQKYRQCNRQRYGLGKAKVTVHPITGQEGPDGEWRYSCILSLTSALDGVGDQRHPPTALHPGESLYPLYRRLGVPQGRCGEVRKTSQILLININ